MRGGKEQLEQAKLQLDQARNAGDLNKAAELQYGTIPTLEKQLADEQSRLADLQKDGVFLKEEVDRRRCRRSRRQMDGRSGFQNARRRNAETRFDGNKVCANESSDRTKPSKRLPMRCAARVPDFKIRIVRSVRLFS